MTFRYTRAPVVRARILDALGFPVKSGVYVEIFCDDGRNTFALTDSDGRIAQRVTHDDPVRLVVSGMVWRGAHQGVYLPFRGETSRVVPSGEEGVVRCDHVEFNRTLTIRVVDPDRAPVEGAIVWSREAALPSEGVRARRTDASGVVQLAGLPPSACSFEVAPGDRPFPEGWFEPAPRRVEPGGQTVTLTMRRAARITGVVRGADGFGVPANLVVTSPDGDVCGTAAGDDGRFAIRVPEDAGPLSLEARWATRSGIPRSAKREGVRPGDDVRLDVD